MSAPLPYGTLLQNRYRLNHLLAEGGFARTYLAEDTGRFGERCLLKEFCPSFNQPEFFTKAQELFQREAQTLYQLDHPQVPKFRALFTEQQEEGQRLFLVQDYVEGETYRSLLQSRLAQGQLFSESDIRQLLEQLLPVLSYIHQKGIIHRDLSLDNLIQRQSDQKPVLIDFGVVKTVMTQLQQSRIIPAGTIVGTMGFAPFEQLQSGQAYPNSDLYALAVCCLVLRSGKEPVELFDHNAATWNWQAHARVSPEFQQVLERMLAHRPSDRYASAQEVLAALKHLPEPPPEQDVQRVIAPQSIPSALQIDTLGAIPAAPEPSSKTQQRQPAIITPVRSPQQSSPAQLNQQRRSSRLIIPLFLFISLLAAGAGWLATQLFLQNRFLQKEEQSGSPTASSTESLTPTASPKLTYSETLQLSPGQSLTVRGQIQPNEMQAYQFSASKGDRFSIQSNSAVKISLLTSNLAPLEIASQSPNTWNSILPKTDVYTLRVVNESAIAQPYQMLVALAATAETVPLPSTQPSSPVPDVSTTPTPTLQMQTLPQNPQRQQLTAALATNHVQRFIVPVSSGMALFANVLEDSPVTITIRDPSGKPLPNAQNVLNTESLIVEGGNYQVDVTPVDTATPTQFVIDLGTRQP